MSDCRISANGREYIGDVSSTQSGDACQRWDSDTPTSHSYIANDFPDATITDAENFCRYMDGISIDVTKQVY